MKRTQFPRHYVFVTQSGKPVIRLSHRTVWDVETQALLPYQHSDYGHAITDGELRQLFESGFISTYDTKQVQLAADMAAPIDAGYNTKSSHIQGYYILTALPASQIDNVRSIMPVLGIGHIIHAEVSERAIAIYNHGGKPFPTLHIVEDVLQQLTQAAPELFSQAVVSLYEVKVPEEQSVQTSLDRESIANISAAIEQGKLVGIVGQVDDEELGAVHDMLTDDIGMTVKAYRVGRDTVPMLEDNPPDMLIVDLQTPGIHGWAFIHKLREVPELLEMPIVIVSENAQDTLLALKIVKVHGFLTRPIDLEKLREKILTTFSAGLRES